MSNESLRDGWVRWSERDTVPNYPEVQVQLRSGEKMVASPDAFTWEIEGDNEGDIFAWRPSNLVGLESSLSTQIGGEHYKKYAIQPVEFITKNKLGFLEGCVIKRICRYEDKNGREDLEKIKHEIDLLIELKYGSQA